MAEQGEGSRGGHIIGHSKVGKPIYGTAKDTASKIEAGKSHAGTVKSISRGVSIAGGVITQIANKHFKWGVKGLASSGMRDHKTILSSAMERSKPLLYAGLGAGFLGNTVGGLAAAKESENSGDSELMQNWESTKEQVYEGALSAAGYVGTDYAYDALKKIGPDLRKGGGAAIKAAQYAGLKTAQYGMRVTRGLRTYAAFMKAKPFATQAFTSASRFLTHIK